MRVCKTAFIGVLLLVICSPVFAADVVKIGYFTRQAIVDRTELGKEGLKRFQGEMKEVRVRLEEQRQKVKELQDEFKKKEQVWNDEVKRRKLEEIMVQKDNLNRAIEQANRQLAAREQVILQPLKAKMMEIIFRIGKEEGYTMILDANQAGIVYAPDSLDLTDRIIRELNEIAAKEASGKQ